MKEVLRQAARGHRHHWNFPKTRKEEKKTVFFFGGGRGQQAEIKLAKREVDPQERSETFHRFAVFMCELAGPRLRAGTLKIQTCC